MPRTNTPLNARREETASRTRILGEAGLLLAIALIFCVLSWTMRSPRLDLRATESRYQNQLPADVVTAAAALSFYEQGLHFFIDVRSGDLESEPSIPGAFAIRAGSFADDLIAASDFIEPDIPLVLYGTDDLHTAAGVAARLRERGYENVVILDGGIAAWQAAGGEVRRSETDSHE